ncbi:SLC13 family permease [Desulfofustis limnaeus]|uniref:RCK C-terminal domain-containing protein n=1 Tax=Desulfofustis limnaeus TaxID=2740163 RepID=A0ABN6M1Z6_9BACT|nr:SLC13 family permease [Desulfofustis limnaeus]BDD86019.1 hypothetical protein DPPLL_03840 [Desulfofustis limnaeus]
MSYEIIVLLVIVSGAMVLFVGGWLRVDLVGLLVLSSLSLTGLITPQEALAGFSSPAVVTVWALFILSAGLTRTGIAHQLGQPLQRFAKGSEVVLIMVLMAAASLLSALINTTTVAAILLPSTMELARRSGRPPSRLLLPLALGCLLGGPFTGISTPPNILVTDAIRAAGFTPFGIFDFTPITAVIVVVGIVFMVVFGRYLLPSRRLEDASGTGAAVGASYQLSTHLFTTRIPGGSPLEGRTIAESRIGSALYLTVLALQRNGMLQLAPRPDQVLQGGDVLIVHGNPSHLQRFHASQHLQVEPIEPLHDLLRDSLATAVAEIGDGSPLIGKQLSESGLRRDYRVHVLQVHGAGEQVAADLRYHRLANGDRLVLQGERAVLESLPEHQLFARVSLAAESEIETLLDRHGELLPIRVPQGSVLAGHDLVESRLSNAFGLTVVALRRDDTFLFMPSPQERVQPDDVLIVQGGRRDLEILEGLQELTIVKQSSSQIAELESQEIGVTEVLLSPRTTLAGKTLAELLFRERYGISVLAVWRKGQARRSQLQDMPLQFGDALLVYGHRSKLEALSRDPDFLVLDKAAARAPRLEKARLSVVIMAAVIISAMTGLLPISIAALVGATIMVLVGCLSMEEAYRAIEWKVIFLIASMLPLGAAIENSGAAQLGAAALVSSVGELGPRWVVAALFGVTVLGTQIIPTAALVVLMSPVALSAAATLSISPHLLMMTVAISASSSFASPLSHPAHLLVMGPGGYRFVDYLKVGVPITILTMAVSVVVLPILWPPY